MTRAERAPGQDGLEPAIRRLELYRAKDDTGRAQPMSQNIEGWLDGDEERDDFGDRYQRVTAAD